MTGEIDEEILPLVDLIRAHPLMTTFASCCGHNRKPASIDLVVKGLVGLRQFVNKLNSVDLLISDPTVFFDAGLIWHKEVSTACNFERMPEWIMLSLSIEYSDIESLKKITEAWKSS